MLQEGARAMVRGDCVFIEWPSKVLLLVVHHCFVLGYENTDCWLCVIVTKRQEMNASELAVQRASAVIIKQK